MGVFNNFLIELTAAEERVNEAWEKVATAVGIDNDWGILFSFLLLLPFGLFNLNALASGKALKEISHRNNEILGIEKEWVCFTFQNQTKIM
jgi:hypothetical protein